MLRQPGGQTPTQSARSFSSRLSATTRSLSTSSCAPPALVSALLEFRWTLVSSSSVRAQFGAGQWEPLLAGPSMLGAPTRGRRRAFSHGLHKTPCDPLPLAVTLYPSPLVPLHLYIYPSTSTPLLPTQFRPIRALVTSIEVLQSMSCSESPMRKGSSPQNVSVIEVTKVQVRWAGDIKQGSPAQRNGARRGHLHPAGVTCPAQCQAGVTCPAQWCTRRL